ncbi:MAG TPA: ice-binding family protein [Kofleriaceae bacterium]|nr:ice-binding family protein [Kofleriaceae bacterium]
MNVLKTCVLLLLASVASACGDQLVEFALDGPAGPDPGNPTSGPTVTSTGPANAAIDVSINKHVRATFSRAMNPATITSSSFVVRQGGVAVAGGVTYANGTASFAPTSYLDLAREYTATITTAATDTQGNALGSNYVWTFATGACSQAPVVLHSAAGFAVLAGSTVTSTGATRVTGDVGVSPGTAVTGFAPGVVIGTMHAGDPAAARAIADLTTAYDDAAGRTLCPVSVAGNLGGQTLVPGLYKSTSSLEITSGDLTLDARGEEDAVFIFQMASTLTTTVGRQIILSGNATAANVFWQVGSSATLGTASAFQGTVMADQAITMATDASLNGRVLARIAGVSLDANAIAMP